MLLTTGTPLALNCTISPTVPNELVKNDNAVPPAFVAVIAFPVKELNPVPPCATAKSVVNVN